MDINNSVETHVVSQVSRIRAANGDSNLSAETLKAIQEGAVPPKVVEPQQKTDEVSNETRELVQNITKAATETAEIQSKEQPAIEDEAVIVTLSDVATELFPVKTQETAEVPATKEVTKEVTEERPAQQQATSPIIQNNVDTASVALGNAVDIKA